MAKASAGRHTRPLRKKVGNLKAGEVFYVEHWTVQLEKDGFTAKSQRRLEIPLMVLGREPEQPEETVRAVVLTTRADKPAGMVMAFHAQDDVFAPRGVHISMWS